MNEALCDIILNIISSILYFMLGGLFAFLVNRYRVWSKTRLIANIYKDKVLAVALTTRDGPYSRSTARVSLAEVDAIINLKSLMGNKVKIELLKSSSEQTILLDKNILVVGGPLANTISAHTLEMIACKLPFVFSHTPRYIAIGNRVYKPEYTNDESFVKSDYAIIVKTDNPFLEDVTMGKKLFLIMGLHGYGTKGAVLALLDKQISKKIWKKVKAGDFAAVLKIEIINSQIKAHLEEVWGI